MFSVSDIKDEAYPASYRRGKELYETGGVWDFSYEVYDVNGLPAADASARVRSSSGESYRVTATVDEEYADITSCSCECEAFFNYEGLCKHCVALLLTYVRRRKPEEILWIKRGGTAGNMPEGTNETVSAMKTELGMKRLIARYSLRAEAAYFVPEQIYGKIELEPYFQVHYSYAQLEFKIGAEKKYVLKNISVFLQALRDNERVHYGKYLDFCHHIDAFTGRAKEIISFLRQQEDDYRRQSRRHAYDIYTASTERRMELDEVGIDRFFAAMGNDGFSMEVDLHPKGICRIAEEEYKPKLLVKGGGAGIFLEMEKLSVITGKKYYYFYRKEMLYRSVSGLKEKFDDLFSYLLRNGEEQIYIAAEELPVFCRDMLPALGEYFDLRETDFDRTLYVPPRPEFELYLDRQEGGRIGAKLLSVYGDVKYNVTETPKPGEVREIREENRIRSLVEPYFNAYSELSHTFILEHNEDLLYQLLSGGLARLSGYMTIYTTEKFRAVKVVSSPAVSVGVSIKSDLLQLEIRSGEMSAEELAYLLSRYDRKKKYIRLKNGDFLDVQEDGLSVLAEVREALQLSEANLKSGSVNVPKYRAMFIDAALHNKKLLSVDKNKEFKGIVRNMKTIEDSDFEVPESLKGIMRAYQKNGFLWLKTLRENGFGGILADDMGLGKTLQVISLLLSEHQECGRGEREPRRSLIVCPASLVYNWQKEIERFAPELPTVIVAGQAAERKEIIRQSREGEILITSYDLLKRDVGEYQDIVFAVQIIDEAQYIKNPGTQAAKGVKKISAAFKLALTGTPIENRLSELWSIFDYLMPGFLYHYQRFREEIEIPVTVNQDSGKMDRLQKMIRPFILRRLKGDVLLDLPDKLEENVFAKMEGEQRLIYDAHAQRLKTILEKKSDKDFRTEKIQILAELTRLRQLCCDPALLLEGYAGTSAKTDVCIELIQNAVNGGHKVLLFSQFTSMLDRLAERLRDADIPYYMLTGSVNKEKRMQMVESFNQDGVPVFCISLKAGGTGLNLTAADIVIHYDPWWNVAVQNQATDRAHRIGQENVVTVYKLVAEGSIEEKIIAIQERKKELAREVLEGEGMDSVTFTKEEIMELLG